MNAINEGDRVTVKAEHKQTRGLSVIKAVPGDVLRVVGPDRTGLFVACRFDDCADTERLHDAFFGLLYVDKNNVQPLEGTL